VGHVDRNERDVRFQVPGSDRWRRRLVRLELDHEVDALANEVLGDPQRHLGLVAVVDDDQLDVLAVGCAPIRYRRRRPISEVRR
jgi:hypothetical protein